MPLSDVLVEGSKYSRHTLKERLYAENLKRPQCELCRQSETWRGRRMGLIQQLMAQVAAEGWSAVGRAYGVSDNAVRKWVREYEREAARAAQGASGSSSEVSSSSASP